MKVLESVPRGEPAYPGGAREGGGPGSELVRVPAPCPRHSGNHDQESPAAPAGGNSQVRVRFAETRTASGALVSLNHWALALGPGAPLPGPAVCDCAFTGVRTGRALSAAVVTDRPLLTVDALRAVLLESCYGQGTDGAADVEARKIAEVAGLYPEGTILGTGPGGGVAVVRPASGLAQAAPGPVAGVARQPAPWLDGAQQRRQGGLRP